MLKRVLLDANAVLNATFIPQSWSRLVVEKLVQRRSDLFVGSRSLLEAVTSARKYARELNKSKDPNPVIEQFIRRVGAIEVPPSEEPVEPQVANHDRHVVQEAITANATILTSDAGLWAGCNAVNRNAVLPLQALEILDGVSLATMIFGIAPARNSGSVFARVIPGGWAGQKEIGQFTIADFEGRLWLHYCTNSQTWVADMPGVGRATVAAQIEADARHIVAVSWEAGKLLRLRVAGTDAIGDVEMRKPLPKPLIGNVAIGNRADGAHHWNGWIRHLVMNDRPIGAKLWTALRASTDLTPNPYDADRLRQSISQFMT
jgi:hypothetical protein